jgi:hypothetical protein
VVADVLRKGVFGVEGGGEWGGRMLVFFLSLSEQLRRYLVPGELEGWLLSG